MAGYLIEYRFHGYAKAFARDSIWDTAKKFRVSGVTKRGHAVPHMTLFGPFNTRQEKKMVSEVVKACQNYSLVPFRIKGFGHFGKEVIYIRIQPSKELEELRRDISSRLLRLADAKQFDENYDFSFHATVAFKDIGRKFDEIWEYIQQRNEPDARQHLLRVTIVKGGRILGEYDLMQRRLLTRVEALSKHQWRRTIELLKSKIDDYESDLEEKPTIVEKTVDRLKWYFRKL